MVRLHGELDTTKKCLTHNGLVAGWRVAALASLFVRMRPLAVLLFSCVTASSHLVRVTHDVPARGRPHIMQLRSPAPLNNKEPVLPRVVAPLNKTEPVLPPVVPLVVQQCVAVVTISWAGFVTLTGLKTRVSSRAEEKEERAVASSQKLRAAGANFVLAIVSFATVLMFAPRLWDCSLSRLCWRSSHGRQQARVQEAWHPSLSNSRRSTSSRSFLPFSRAP